MRWDIAEACSSSRCGGGARSGLILLALVALGTAFLTLQSASLQPDELLAVKVGAGDGQAIAQELSRLRSDLKGNAMDHHELGLRLANIERIMGMVLNNSEFLLRGSVPPEKRKAAAPPQQPSVIEVPAASTELRESVRLNGTDKGRGLEILIVSDEAYLKGFYRQVLAMRCYAWRHGYAFSILQGSPQCRQRDFFFRKHCTVAVYLSSKPERYTVMVLDGDVVPVSMERRLDAWVSGAEDLVFYEREWSSEVAAGNYIVRNTAFARRFLLEWANLEAKRPPGGIFSGADNGAIHVLLPDALGVPCAGVVAELYGRLSHVGINASDVSRIPLEYKNFVAAAELIRGPPRRWLNISKWGLAGGITILPRLHAWVADWQVTSGKGSQVGSVFHHGVKTQQDMGRYFDATGLSRCTPLSTAVVDRDTFLATMQRYLDMIRQHYGVWRLPNEKQVPFHEAAMHCCMHNLSCRPLEPGEALPLGGGKTYKDPLRSAVAVGSGAAGGCLDPEAPPPELPTC